MQVGSRVLGGIARSYRLACRRCFAEASGQADVESVDATLGGQFTPASRLEVSPPIGLQITA